MAGNKKGFIDYMSRNPVGLATRPRAYEVEFVVASLNSFVINLEMIDNFFLNILVNNNWLIQKLCKNRRKLTCCQKSQSYLKSSAHSDSSYLNKLTLYHSSSKLPQTQSSKEFIQSSKKFVHMIQNPINHEMK